MITRIVLENYMSHRRTVIEPAAGLTVLVGPNNCGKSAVLSALQTLCGDNAGDYMVRHGEKTCSVTVQTDDGHEITWRRIKGKVSYVIDNTEVHRAGTNLPDNLQELLRLPAVKHPNGKEFDVHFAGQKTPIFLLDDEAGAAAFFSTSGDAERLLEMQKLHKQKKMDAARDLREIDRDLKDIDRRLASLDPLDEMSARIEQVEKAHAALAEVELLAREIELIISQVEGQRRLMANHQRRADELKALQAPPALEEIAPLERLISQMTSQSRQAARNQAKLSRLQALEDAPAQADTAELERLIRQMSKASRDRAAAARRAAALAEVREPATLDDPAPLSDLLARHAKIARDAATHRAALRAADDALKRVDAQIAAWLAENPTCPTCGSPTTLDAVMAGGHAHE